MKIRLQDGSFIMPAEGLTALAGWIFDTTVREANAIVVERLRQVATEAEVDGATVFVLRGIPGNMVSFRPEERGALVAAMIASIQSEIDKIGKAARTPSLYDDEGNPLSY